MKIYKTKKKATPYISNLSVKKEENNNNTMTITFYIGSYCPFLAKEETIYIRLSQGGEGLFKQ